jgi:hypothetical protein
MVPSSRFSRQTRHSLAGSHTGNCCRHKIVQQKFTDCKQAGWQEGAEKVIRSEELQQDTPQRDRRPVHVHPPAQLPYTESNSHPEHM